MPAPQAWQDIPKEIVKKSTPSVLESTGDTEASENEALKSENKDLKEKMSMMIENQEKFHKTLEFMQRQLQQSQEQMRYHIAQQKAKPQHALNQEAITAAVAAAIQQLMNNQQPTMESEPFALGDTADISQLNMSLGSQE